MYNKTVALAIFTSAILIMPFIFNTENLPKSQMEIIATQTGPDFKLLPLPYAYDALEPYIDKLTLELHHDKHHKTYVDNLNKAVGGTSWEGKTFSELFQSASKLPTDIRNNAGGHWNHTFYWQVMAPGPEKKKMAEALKQEIIDNFGSIDKFREEFRNAGLKRFGSGYVWLVRTKEGLLKICSTPYQDNPLMNDAPVKGEPLLICDVWEHSYYLKYHNLRGDYLDAFFQLAFPSGSN